MKGKVKIIVLIFINESKRLKYLFVLNKKKKGNNIFLFNEKKRLKYLFVLMKGKEKR
jgi:hypothetical protein